MSIPKNDADLDAWGANFVVEFANRAAAMGFTPADTALVTGAYNDYHTYYGSAIAARETARAQVAQKDANREIFEGLARGYVRRLQTAPAMTNAIREEFRITIPDPSRTLPPPPTTRPTARFDLNNRLEHVFRLGDEMTPDSTARPPGVTACEVWRKIGGEPPADLSECTLAVATPKAKNVLTYTGEQANQTVFYILRWVDRKGRTGPASPTFAVTVAA